MSQARRRHILIAAAGFAALSRPALAQQAARVRRIGYLSGSSVKSNAARLAAFREGMTSDKARELLGKLGADPFPGTPESLEKFVDSEIEKWGRHVKPAGIRPE